MKKIYIYLSWLIALISLLGSLYFSEVMHYGPCTLCWWQRIFMYPLVFIFGVGIILQDPRLPYYVLPLSLAGLGVSFYQNLLTWGVISERYAPCTLGVSCATKYIEWFGFISIPFISLLGFLLISIMMILLIRLNISNDK